jgi:hypothetical protein
MMDEGRLNYIAYRFDKPADEIKRAYEILTKELHYSEETALGSLIYSYRHAEEEERNKKKLHSLDKLVDNNDVKIGGNGNGKV